MDNQEMPSLMEEGQQLFSSEYEISPEFKQSNQAKLFGSPIYVAEFMEMPKQQGCSPELFVEFSDSFRRIIEKDNEESSENEQIIDIMGNRICEFDPKDYEESPVPYSPIEEDKQNQKPSSYLNTPLKIRRVDIRSPLQDITPSMTQKKKKTATMLTVSEKTKLLTPRTIEKSGLASSGLRRLERF